MLYLHLNILEEGCIHFHLGSVLPTQKFEIRHREVQNPSFGNKNSYFSVHALLHHIMENFRGVVVVVVGGDLSLNSRITVVNY